MVQLLLGLLSVLLLYSYSFLFSTYLQIKEIGVEEIILFLEQLG